MYCNDCISQWMKTTQKNDTSNTQTKTCCMCTAFELYEIVLYLGMKINKERGEVAPDKNNTRQQREADLIYPKNASI